MRWLFPLLLLATWLPQPARTAQPAGAQELAGDWEGSIAGKLPVVLHLRFAENMLLATLDSPTQGAYGLAGASEKLEGTKLSFDVPVVKSSFMGEIGSDGRTIAGTWTQAGQSSPLSLRQTVTAAELAQIRPSPVDGDWSGVLRAGSVSLRLIFHLRAASGGRIACAVDSLDQVAMGIPCADVKLDGQQLSLAVPAVRGSYTGTLSDDGRTLHGQWSQGEPLELNLKRTVQIPPQVPQPAFARAPVSLQELRSALDRELVPVMEGWPQGGLVAGITEHGQREVMAWGTAKADSIFEIGSVTKTFTALTLAQMVEQKKVTLGEPIRELLPPGSVARPPGPEITLLDLATQHSGLPRLPDNMQPADPADPYADY